MELTLTREVKKTETVTPVVVLAFGPLTRRIVVVTEDVAGVASNFDIYTDDDEYMVIRVPRGNKG